jgi:hypothetical protein
MLLQEVVQTSFIVLGSKDLPDIDDINGLKTTQFWRIFLGLIFLAGGALVSTFRIKYHTPKYH